MIVYQLEKKVKLFKSQFDKFCLQIFGDNRLDRISLELENIIFKNKYEIKKDLFTKEKEEEYAKDFSKKSIELQNLFTEFLLSFLHRIIGFKNTSDPKCIIDILSKDMKMDSNNVEFNMVIISNNKEYLDYIDKSINEYNVFNMFPNEFFRYSVDSYNDAIAKAYPELFENKHQDEIGVGSDGDVFCHNLTFTVTNRCSLNCRYCYEFNKNEERMTFDIAKEFIDHLLNDDYGYINKYNSPAIIIEFIGGEPLIEIELIRKIYEYFLDRCYELNHPWFNLHRISLCSNGLSYFDDEVQSFFKEYYEKISFNISIDGNKELHDACRVQPNGEGSYDVDMVALNHFNKNYASERNSKMTLAPSNIKYLYDSVIDFIKNDMKCININCVFEEGWTKETAREEYFQLKKLADYVIDNNLENIYIAIFNDRQEDMQPKENDGTFCGGTGSMLAVAPNGTFYPCIRYMPTSVGKNVKDLSLGNVKTGFIGREENSEVLEMMDKITRRSSVNDICYECPISNDCPACSALGQTVFGTPEKRCSFICIQMIAEALANVYFWNRLLLKHTNYDLHPRRNVLPDEWSLLVIDEDELNELKLLELSAMISYMENYE